MIRALTIRQPWASLIVEGVKPVENRSWDFGRLGAKARAARPGFPDDATVPGFVVPDVWVAVHAGRVDDLDVALRVDLINALALTSGIARRLEDLPTRAVIGAMRIDWTGPLDEYRVRYGSTSIPGTGDVRCFESGPRCWRIGAFVELDEPVTGIPGALGLWRLPETVEARVADAALLGTGTMAGVGEHGCRP